MKKRLLGWLILLIVGLALSSGCGKTAAPVADETNNDRSATLEAYEYIQDNFLYADRLPTKYSLLSGEALSSALLADYGSIEAFIYSLDDPYTRYVTYGEDRLDNSLSGSAYGGIGIVVKKVSSEVIISYVMPDEPASKAGVKNGDKIVEVDGISVANFSLNDVVDLVRGSEGSSVDLKVLRGQASQIIKIRREKIETKDVYSERLNNNIGYIKILQFGYSVSSDFDKAYNSLPNSIAGLIIDLRDNGGGELSNTIGIASNFVPEDKSILWYKRKDGEMRGLNSRSGIKIKLPVVVLVNGGSASAAEILAAALAERDNATLVGETTYGKGTMQSRYYLSNDDYLYITVAEYFTPTQKKVDGVGIAPSVSVALTDADILAGLDPQLASATAELTSKLTAQSLALNMRSPIEYKKYLLPTDLERVTDMRKPAIGRGSRG